MSASYPIERDYEFEALLWESSESEPSEDEFIDPKLWESLSSEDDDEIDPKFWESSDSEDIQDVSFFFIRGLLETVVFMSIFL